MFKQTKNNQQGFIFIFVALILSGAVFSAALALGAVTKFAKLSVNNLDVYSAVSSCMEFGNGYAQITCDTEGLCLDVVGACIACGEDGAINTIGSNCSCQLEVYTSGDPRLLLSRAWCSRGDNYVYDSNYIYWSSTGGGWTP